MGNGKSAKLDLARKDFSLRNRRGGIQTDYRSFGELRHKKQIERIKEVKGIAEEDKGITEEERILLFSKFERGIYFAGNPRDPSRCCLFNVIVAFEWNPGYYEIERLRATCDEAANLLFDVTDGYMSFNRIIIGGPELIKCADVQIFASNRLFPRAWVNGLHIEEKYQPIRIGRGYWRKNAGRADPWHKNLGAAVLVHEWLHYAVGMKDDYVKSENGYALPTSSPVVNTLMANLESSELKGKRLGLKDKEQAKDEWEQLKNNTIFSWLEIPADYKPQNIPPDVSPAPRFNPIGTAKEDSEDDQQVWLNWNEADLTNKIAPDHCWVFVLISKDLNHPLTTPTQLIAQGSYENLPEGYQIIGVQRNARIILIGHALDTHEPKVLYRKVAGTHGSTIEFEQDGWKDATFTDCQLPLVAVSIVDKTTTPPYQLNMDILKSDERNWTATLFPLGEQAIDYSSVEKLGDRVRLSPKNGEKKVEALDGHVLLVSSNPDKDNRLELAIANFSIGGSPGAAYPGSPNPVPAGSSDGNAMIFFYDGEAMKLRENVTGEQIVLNDVTGEQIVLNDVVSEQIVLTDVAGEHIVLDASLLRIIPDVAGERIVLNNLTGEQIILTNVVSEQIVLTDVAGKWIVLDASSLRIIPDVAGKRIVLDASSLRIITTTNLHSPSSNIGCGPRGYTFTLMPNETLPNKDGVPDLNPTLVLYFDADTKKDHPLATLKIHRRVGGEWKIIAENYQKEDPDRLLVAARLNNDTAPGLFQNPPMPECYRMFLMK